MNDQNSDIIIGEQPGWGDPQPFGIAAVDERQHLYIIGKTGSGKTTLLRNLRATTSGSNARRLRLFKIKSASSC